MTKVISCATFFKMLSHNYAVSVTQPRKWHKTGTRITKSIQYVSLSCNAFARGNTINKIVQGRFLEVAPCQNQKQNRSRDKGGYLYSRRNDEPRMEANAHNRTQNILGELVRMWLFNGLRKAKTGEDAGRGRALPISVSAAMINRLHTQILDAAILRVGGREKLFFGKGKL